jgi:hypothetical protein
MSTAAMMRRLAQENGPLPPDVDGLGYKTTNVQGGAGFSYTRYAEKQIGDITVGLVECFPSPFEDKPITSRYMVYIGMSDMGEALDCPFECPVGAEGWAPDGEVHWYANFGENGEAAEAFATTNPKIKLAIPESKLELYFRPAADGGMLEAAREALKG